MPTIGDALATFALQAFSARTKGINCGACLANSAGQPNATGWEAASWMEDCAFAAGSHATVCLAMVTGLRAERASQKVMQRPYPLQGGALRPRNGLWCDERLKAV